MLVPNKKKSSVTFFDEAPNDVKIVAQPKHGSSRDVFATNFEITPFMNTLQSKVEQNINQIQQHRSSYESSPKAKILSQ